MDLAIGTQVVFGRPNGQKRHGEILKVNQKSYLIKIVCHTLPILGGQRIRVSKSLVNPVQPVPVEPVNVQAEPVPVEPVQAQPIQAEPVQVEHAHGLSQIEYLKATIENLKAENGQFRKDVNKLLEENDNLKTENEKLKKENSKLKKFIAMIRDLGERMLVE